jgi:hypothetical protein
MPQKKEREKRKEEMRKRAIMTSFESGGSGERSSEGPNTL